MHCWRFCTLRIILSKCTNPHLFPYKELFCGRQKIKWLSRTDMYNKIWWKLKLGLPMQCPWSIDTFDSYICKHFYLSTEHILHACTFPNEKYRTVINTMISLSKFAAVHLSRYFLICWRRWLWASCVICKQQENNNKSSLCCICYGLNLFPVQIFQTSLYFSNWFIFIKLVHIFQTGSYFSNWVEIFKPV